MSDTRQAGRPHPAAGSELRADCANCFGLCCVALAFTASADFAADKAAGEPCGNLGDDFRCGIHTRLRAGGYAGCAVYDCFGAGQRISQRTFGGRDWRRHPAQAETMFAVLPVMRQLHEMLWYLAQARTLEASGELGGALREAAAATERLAAAEPAELLALDVAAHRATVNTLLLRTSERARARAGRRAPDRRGADLIGAKLRGAKLRGADLRGADLTGALFVTRSQLDAARGDARTRVPAALDRPAHWTP
ncbi:pentapeptide repeat-containing protein [Allonocardiopsis opalescens]|uniref:Pentapeptide repeat protein n=1 Tax=Allonocardiopsis opalescens TaxID=1144618 RepID=A0A2T0Q7R0_9ACTN|nr:pentapeptide repeat-containing protein [Allonocardiopsis opalescens]PRX99865.1 pentapeptide repeat protein [Allonocardiopsis opalescens]